MLTSGSLLLLTLRRLHLNGRATVRADERDDLLHSSGVSIWGSAMRTGHPRASSWRGEDLARRALPHLCRQTLGIGRIRVEMSDGLLQPRNDVGY